MKKYILPILIIISSLALSLYFFPLLPESMASHWNAQGIVDDYSSKLSNVIAFPSLSVLLFVLFLIIPKIDPKRINIKTFEDKFNLFIYSMLGFILLLQLQVFLWNTGTQIPMNIVMPILMGLLFIVMAELVKNAKQNYTIGIRTPWTLASEKVWDKTHALGAKLFRISGILSILSAFISKYAFIVVISTVLFSTFIVLIYSYFEFKKEAKE